ncbi:hypothetical protein BIW11_04732 [Tropilaelaps mercedesae]|uniref:Uncharacterized protein n=1 Tax=Tropilaelaps mercedesae TaxID=418985 RepID=A0A1V9X289_9ACAR|nr:hypothetical protein BIW11_04732 [Tropilaelaps mercedesae]
MNSTAHALRSTRVDEPDSSIGVQSISTFQTMTIALRRCPDVRPRSSRLTGSIGYVQHDMTNSSQSGLERRQEQLAMMSLSRLGDK